MKKDVKNSKSAKNVDLEKLALKVRDAYSSHSDRVVFAIFETGDGELLVVINGGERKIIAAISAAINGSTEALAIITAGLIQTL